MSDALLACAHSLSFASVAACLGLQWRLCRPSASVAEVGALSRVDLAYVGAAAVLLLSGLGRLFVSPKGVDFYTANPFFHAKLGLYFVIALISIPASLRFIRWSRRLKSNATDLPPGGELLRTRRLVSVEVCLLALLPLLAAFMARGIGT
ncbi:MAG TPA: DUF2214 family protein [Acidiferrobacterales bacterium]|nr:DUF2214 family protein [Acidiferrobacterales bacterium]